MSSLSSDPDGRSIAVRNQNVLDLSMLFLGALFVGVHLHNYCRRPLQEQVPLLRAGIARTGMYSRCLAARVPAFLALCVIVICDTISV